MQRAGQLVVMILLSILLVVLGETSLAYILPIGSMDAAIVFFYLSAAQV